MNKSNVLNVLFFIIVITSISGFIYTNSNTKTVRIEPIKNKIANKKSSNYHQKVNLTKNLTDFPAPKQYCLSCHDGLAPIREHNSEMMQKIYEKGAKMGDPNGCIVCHNGKATETNNKEKAHGQDFIRYPASPWVADKTCGQCHETHTYNTHRNLMQTEAGKIQGALWGWGASLEGSKVIYGNYDIDDPDGATPSFGTETYKTYMHNLAKKYPDVFPNHLKQLPEADVSSINEHPEQAVLTYLRSECLRCHVGVRGKQRRGDYRGMGCAACHIPYSDEGLYEGKDKSISKTERGHLLVHSIQSSREVKVTLGDKTYSGIPNETCSTCHNRGKRIGVSYQGLMESPYTTTWNDDGSDQYKLHGKRYSYIRDDVHHNPDNGKNNPAGGMLCQDCHTTTSVHGNGNIGGTTLAEVEIECADCHGIPDKYPWELPIGFQDEYELKTSNSPRGLTKELPKEQKFATVYPPEDGYLISARGNPLGNVVKKGKDVILHSARGFDLKVPVLKKIKDNNTWKHPEKAITAMVSIGAHIENMECYACHSTWAPQCYGCHVKIDYSQNKQARDWLKTGSMHFLNGETAETHFGAPLQVLQGKATESRSYTRWEDPILGINGEGRVTPIIPGCQQITTVIGTDGKPVIVEKVWRTPAGTENGGEEGQRGIDMSPAQPHTVSSEARDCASCHTNPKTLGYGINGGKYMQGYDKDRYADLRDKDGNPIAKNSRPQFSKMEDLPIDLSQVVTRDGKQLQTVGHHWPLSAPLSQEQRERMERAGVCIACHKDIPDGNVAMSIISAAGNKLGMTPHSDMEHSKLLNKSINLAAIVQILIPVLLVLGLIIGWWIKRKNKF